MNRKLETALLIILPIIIIGLVIYNSGVMSRIYMIENGLDQESKICKARILPDQYDITLKQGEKIQLNVELLNQGNFIWLCGGDNAVHLSYHILDKEKKMLVYDNPRYNLPNDIRPDADVKIKAEILPELEPGDYILELDLVEEGVTWFGDKGSPTSLVKLHITK